MAIYYNETTPDLANANIQTIQSNATVSNKELNTLKGVDTSSSIASQITTAGAVVMADLDSAILKEATGSLTQANITGMNATPVELIAAPAAGSAIVVDEIELFHDYATAAYTSGGDVSIKYGTSGAVITLVDVAFVTGTSDINRWIRPTIYNLDASTGTATGFDILTAAATNVSITNATAAFANGNASNIIKWRIRYKVVTLLV